MSPIVAAASPGCGGHPAAGHGPSLRVAILEADRIGEGASGRNGGFCAASLTHGLSNGLLHFPDEIDVLEREGVANLAGLVEFVRAEGIECELEETGTLDVATEPYQLAELREYAELAARHGHTVELLERDAVQALVHSPRWLAGCAHRTGPVRDAQPGLARLGLAAAAERRGAVIAEGAASGPAPPRRRRARRGRGGAALEAATSSWRRRPTAAGCVARPAVRPVYDYVLITEPLSPGQREADRVAGPRGAMSDAGNQFHYFRQTADHRSCGRLRRDLPPRQPRDARPRAPAGDVPPAARPPLPHFREAFPQLDGIRFDYRWAGAIDTTTRFTVTFGETMGGRVHYALGYTGLGVGSTRWAAGILRDRLLRPDSPLLDLRFVRSTPFPIPPEPLRTPAVELMRREVSARTSTRGGDRCSSGARTLGIGFNS